MLSLIGRLGSLSVSHYCRAPTAISVLQQVPALTANTPFTTPLFGSTQPTTIQSVRSFRSGRSRRGLYDGKDVRSGNQRSFAMNATKRKFKPNVQHKKLYSELLDRSIRFHVTTAALRSIDKAGGLDNYLFKNEFTEGEGWYWKRVMKRVLKNRKKREKKAKLLAQAGQEELSTTGPSTGTAPPPTTTTTTTTATKNP